MTPPSALAALAAAIATDAVEIIDLTFTLTPDFPTITLPPEFAASAPVRIAELSRYNSNGPAWYWNNLSFGEHTGTHLDAPIHWHTGRNLPDNAVDTMPAKSMIAPAIVIDCAAQAAENPDFLLTRAQTDRWEAQHGPIPEGAWVLLRTDWSKRPPHAYANLQTDGAHTPGPDAELMHHLVHTRKILGFGTETIGTDAGQAHHFTPPFPAHHYLHGAGRYGLQCLRNLDLLPPTGAVLVTAPLKILNGSGSPLRVLALVQT